MLPLPAHPLELAGETTPHLRVVDPELDDLLQPTADLADRILAALARADRPLSRNALRETLGRTPREAEWLWSGASCRA